MLQKNKTDSDTGRILLERGIVPKGQSLQEFSGFLRRQFPVIVVITALAAIIGSIYVITTRPTFAASAQLLIDTNKVDVFNKQPLLSEFPIDSAQVESQVEVLKSDNIALAVVKNLNLTQDPEFVGAGAGFIGTIFNFVSDLFDNDQVSSEVQLTRQAVRAFKDRLSIHRVGFSYVIQISFESYDPTRAAQIANAVADAYITDQMEAKYQATQRASIWLQERIKELRDQVTTAERAVVDFKTKNNIVTTGGADKRLIGDQQVAELSSQLVIARAGSAEARARLDRINSIISSNSPDATVDATVADTLHNDVVSKLRSQYLDLAARESDWSARYGKDHLAVVNLRNQMAEIRNSIYQELQRLGETYKSDYDIAKQREQGIQTELAQAVTQSQTTRGAEVSLGELESSAQTYKTLYENFLQRYTEAVQQQSFPITDARLISLASPPMHKSRPRTLLDLATAGLAGIILGFGIGMLRDMADRVFRTSEQVEGLLGVDCIGIVPLLTTDLRSNVAKPPKPGKQAQRQTGRWSIANMFLSRSSQAIREHPLVSDLHGAMKSTKAKIDAFSSLAEDLALKKSAPQLSAAPPGSRTIAAGGGTISAILDAPQSRFAEAIRSIKLAMDLNGAVRVGQIIGLTSSLPNEGKSTIATALAQLTSHVGKRVILIDFDLRNPSTSRTLAPNANSGLLEVLSGSAAIDKVLWTHPKTGFSFLPCAAKTRPIHTNEIIASPATKILFEQLRKHYDYILVDLPPLAPVVDVRAAADLIDAFIYVVEWGCTRIDVVKHALGHAPDIHEHMLGVVLNKVDMNVFRRFASDQESYYYNKYYTQYGYTE